MTVEQAYKAMIAFLEYYISHGYDELTPLLEEMKLVGEGQTKNPELWDEWLEAVKEAEEKGIEATRLRISKDFNNSTDA